MILALKHQLSEEHYYWYNLPKSAGYPFLALVEHTNFVPADKFGGDHIVYIGDYLEPDHEYFKLTQEELLQRFLPAMKKFNPEFRARLGPQNLAVPNGLCPTRTVGQPLEKYSRYPHAHPGSLFRLHEPGLSMGPGHQLCGRDRPQGRPLDAGRRPEIVFHGP